MIGYTDCIVWKSKIDRVEGLRNGDRVHALDQLPRCAGVPAREHVEGATTGLLLGLEQLTCSDHSRRRAACRPP